MILINANYTYLVKDILMSGKHRAPKQRLYHTEVQYLVSDGNSNAMFGVVRCGEDSIRKVVVGEIRRGINFYEGHLLFGSVVPLNLTELLSD